MLTVILLIVVAIIGLLAWNYIKGRQKPQSEKSNLESIASTLGNKMSQEIGAIASGLRTPEQIKEEVMAEFERTKKTLKKQYTSYVEGIVSIDEEQKVLIDDLKKRESDILKKAKKLKKEYEASGNEQAKSTAEIFLSQVINLREQIEKCSKIKESALEKISSAGYTYDTVVVNLAVKRAEAISKISDLGTSFQLETSGITELLDEFNEKVLEKRIETRTQEIVNKDETLSPQAPDASDEAISKIWEELD